MTESTKTVWEDGTQLWTTQIPGNRPGTHNVVFHREDGPAIIHINNTKEYFVMGKRHRIDGPAIEYDLGGYAMVDPSSGNLVYRPGRPAYEIEVLKLEDEYWINNELVDYMVWLVMVNELTPA